MGKLIDITSRVRSQKDSGIPTQKGTPVVDMTVARAEMLNQERREIKRTILTEFVSAHAVVADRGLMKITLYDISDNGLAFDLDPEQGMFKEGEELALRVYLNH